MKSITSKILKVSKIDKVILDKTFKSYTTIGIYSLESINPLTDKSVSGYKMKKSSHRYQLFNRDEKICVCCGTNASFWALQFSKGHENHPHVNLYGIDKTGNTVLFTKDHIMPRSMGGKDDLENYQIMCETCNKKKDNNIDWKAVGIKPNTYKVEVQLLSSQKTILENKHVVVEANNENNAKGIACKITREENKYCNRIIPISVAMI